MSDATTEVADFESHRIVGMLGTRALNVPLISHITGNLWTGGCIDGVRLPDDFDFVLSLYPWEKYLLGARTARVEFRMLDSHDMPSRYELLSIARIANAFVESGKTLIHCEAGLNRSGLVAALALMTGDRCQMSSRGALRLLRSRRSGHVLCNPAFEAFVLGGVA